MTSRAVGGLAACAALTAGLTALPAVVERLAPQPGLVRSLYAQPGFSGAAVESRTAEINLRFLDEQPDLPREHFSARWRGFFFVSEAQTIEFFAGGNDEVELRVDGELLLRRNLQEGLRTVSHRVRLEAGAHELAVDFQQFSGGTALNIQRALAGQSPSPFPPTELFSGHVTWWHLRALDAVQRLRTILPLVWTGFAILVVAAVTPRAVRTWRRVGAPRSTLEYTSRLTLFAAPALLAPFVVFIVGPHTIFTNNPGEFSVTFRELAMPWLLRAAGINWLLLFGLGCVIAVLSDRLSHVYAAVLFAVGLLLWGQGNLWNADYGVLAGREVDLAEHASRAPYELAAFVTVVLLAVVLYRPVARVATFASLVFIALQTVAAAATGFGSSAERPQWIDPPQDIFRFSAEHNVIHIVLDEFQSDFFADILRQKRDLLDRDFSGFVYFEDHAGTFPTTSFSMPAMLTGREYRNEKLAPEFVREVSRQDSLFNAISRAGYDVDAISIVPLASFEDWFGPETHPNWRGERFRIRKPFLDRGDYREVTAGELLQLSLFRHVPHSAKVFITEHPAPVYRALSIADGESPAQIRRHEASNSVAFLEHFIESMGVGRERPVYKLIHAGVPHRPIVVDRECRFFGVTRITRQNYRDQSQCAVKLVAALLDRARALGIYDSSLIIVSSDHGTDLTPRGFNGVSESLSLTRGPAIPRLGAIAATAKALMLVKPPNRSGPIVISDAPTSHVDFKATVFDLLGLEGGPWEASMFRRDAKQPRTRSFGMYDFRQRFPKEYLDRIYVLSIDGRVVDAAGWNSQRTAWPPTSVLPSPDADFLTPGSQWHLGPGWSMERQESSRESGRVTFVQALTRRAVLFIPSSAHELILRARSSKSGAVEVSVDGRPMGRLDITDGGFRDYPITITTTDAHPSISTVTLAFDAMPDAGQSFRLDRLAAR